MSKSLKKLVEESREKNQPEVDMSDRGISNMLDVHGLFSLSHITQLVLSHNKLTTVPANIAELKNLEVLNFFNNQIEELPTQISSLQKLKHLNLGMNRLNTLPRGFGSLPALEVLDLTYNNLNENSLPGNFFYLTTLRALYLSDNDFEILPPDIGKLTKLQILSLRDNDLISLPKEIGELTQLKELHIQGNRLTVLPPELVNTQPQQECLSVCWMHKVPIWLRASAGPDVLEPSYISPTSIHWLQFSRVQLLVLDGVITGFVASAQSRDLFFCRCLPLEKEMA
ncbi:Ras suppressor protein 1 [Myotis brandtii]|uniref:Ras suppressor protein 1 n=1 Tax=Myotis brandtii TaxID=109478 RepID=S7NHK5_MYOBR|nr:Ras suppressor protein 1 [Myotis brandtii]